MDLYGSEAAAIAIGLFITGVFTLITALQRNASGKWQVNEPVWSIAIAAVYLPITYGVAATDIAPGSNVGRLVVCLSIPLSAHLAAKLALVIDRRSKTDLLTRRGVRESQIHESAVYVSRSAEQYRTLIVPAERDATTIDRLPKRLSVVFKSVDTVESIALQRFVEGSSSIDHYVTEHADRSREFFSALRRGARCREIYSQIELQEYFASGQHGSNVLLTDEQLADNLRRWVSAIQAYPNYQVAITTQRLPFKYEIIDSRIAILHEAIGSNDRGRLNALAIEGQDAVSEFIADFDILWDNVSQDERNKTALVSWINNTLLPLARQPKGIVSAKH